MFFVQNHGVPAPPFPPATAVVHARAPVPAPAPVRWVLIVASMNGLFWSIFFFNVVGDVYGPTAGGLAVLVPSVGSMLLCVWLMSKLQSTRATAAPAPAPAAPFRK